MKTKIKIFKTLSMDILLIYIHLAIDIINKYNPLRVLIWNILSLFSMTNKIYNLLIMEKFGLIFMIETVKYYLPIVPSLPNCYFITINKVK